MACSGGQETSSDETFPSITKLLCDPCGEEGTILNAEGYCLDCCEYLCITCFQHHCTPKPFRKHKLLDKHQMPQTKSDRIYKDECTELCGTHAGKVLECFCEEHKQFVCTLCVITGHKGCTVGYIPELSKDLFNSQEFKELENNIVQLQCKILDIKRFAKENLKITHEHAEGCRDRIKQFRKEINEFFDKLENDAYEEVSIIQKENKDKIVPLLDQGKELGECIEDIQKKLDTRREKNQKCSLFIDMKHFIQKIKEYSSDVTRLEKENIIHEIVFSPTKEIKNIIRDYSKRLGSFVDFHSIIPTKTDTDKTTCDIHHITVMSNDRIVVSDWDNKCLKLIDTSVGKVLKSKLISSIPSGMTTVSDHEIAVIHLGNIEIYSVTDEITLKQTIRNIGLGNRGLGYSNNRFIGLTSSYPPSVRILDMKGTEIKSFPTEVNDKVLFKDPWYIAVNTDRSAIYVSDWGMKAVICLSFTGEVRAEYKPDYDWSPWDIAVSRNGTVYVCDSLNDKIHILASDLQEIDVINGDRYGIKGPAGAAYCDREHKLYVGFNGNEVSVFNI